MGVFSDGRFNGTEPFYNVSQKLPTYQNLSRNSSDLSVEQGLDLFKKVGAKSFGSYNITGIALLGIIAALLYKADASLDQSAAILTPAVFVLGNYGFLPGGSGLIYGSMIAAATLFTFGLVRYI